MMWKLIGLSESIEGQQITIDRDLLLGRHQQADIVLPSATVSRRHAGIEYRQDGTVWIQDLGSSNGTLVNGIAISEPTLLQHGDEIQLQDIIFQVISEQDDEQNEQSIHTDSLMNQRPRDEGMPTLQERSIDVQVRADGTPQTLVIPKPAPIPEHIDIHAPVVPETQSLSMSQPTESEHAKNAKAGIITWVIIVVAVVIAIIAFLR